MARAATKDFELHGTTIKENDRLLLWYIASNRDETAFDNPNKFDITREGLADRHQAFGGRGRHFCLGANLARPSSNCGSRRRCDGSPILRSTANRPACRRCSSTSTSPSRSGGRHDQARLP